MEEDEFIRKIDLNVKLDTYKGNLFFNFFDIIDQLDDETKKQILSDAGWFSFITHEMARSIVEEFSRENYNRIYTDLRGIIINSESMPKVIREWAESLIESRESAKEESGYWQSSYYKLWHFIGENFSDIQMPSLSRQSYNRPYTKELLEKVDKLVEEWANLFPEKVDEENA